MTTFVSGLFGINGVISTDKSVMDNLNTLCTAAGAWMTYDIVEGKWSVIINRAGSSVTSFNDSNILGGINVSGTGVAELYNSVTIEFPHKDLRDQTDYIDFEIDAEDRFPNELDNRLNISIDCVNDPIQAAYIAAAELKQSRVDKVIEFRTDYTKLGLKAGDLIDVTSTVYGYTNKVFRIVKMEEADEEGLIISITALEYDANVYSTDGLTRKLREKKTGIVPKDANTALTDNDNAANAASLTNALNDPKNAALIIALLSALSKNIGGGGGDLVSYATFTTTRSTAVVDAYFNYAAGTPPVAYNTSHAYTDGSINVSIPVDLSGIRFKTLQILVSAPLGNWSYQYYNSTTGSVGTRTTYSYFPCQINLLYNGSLLQLNTVDWQTPQVNFIIQDAAPGVYELQIFPIQTYDLNQNGTQDIWPYSYASVPQATGGGVTVSFFGFLA